MLFREIFNNIKEDIKLHFIKYAFLYAPLFGIITYFLVNTFIDIKINEQFMPNLVNISGVLAGFLFTSLGILISLPENKFIIFLKETGHMKIIFNSMIIGIMLLLISMVLGLFDFCNEITIYIFVGGISETFISAYYLYKVSYYSGKSK